MNIPEAAAQLRARKISAVELAQQSLRMIRAQQSRLNAFITITEELALEQASQADDELARGIDRGPLHGIPYALKDLFETKGIRTTCGSKIFADYIPDRDSAVYEKLTAAGAVLTGKTGLQELACGITCNNPHFGAIRNPHDPERIPGGSSGGSGVAVATDMVFFAMGSDTGGSIRIPAAFCGCVGLKPTYGRVSRYGAMPLGFSLDHMGPMTRSAHDAGLVMNAIAGFDARDDTSSRAPVVDFTGETASLRGTRIGLPENFYNQAVSPEVADAFAHVIEQAQNAGAVIVPMRVPDPAEMNMISRVILLAEASAVMLPHLHRRADFGADVLALFDQGRFISATDYVNAQRLRRIFQNQWSKLYERVDCIFTPTAPILAPLIGELQVTIGGVIEDARLASTRFVRAINLLGNPAISVPLPGTELPTGLQIIGKRLGEAEVLSVASALSSQNQ